MPRGERAEHEIFEARLGRARVAALEGGEDIGGEALQLEADIEGEQVAGRDHHPHADRREQDQHRIFGAIIAVAAEPAHRREHRDRGAGVDQDLRRRRRSCRRRTGRRRRCRRRRATPGRKTAATASSSDGEPGQQPAPTRSPRPGRGQHQQQRADAQYLLGEDEEEIVQHQWCAPPARRAQARPAARRAGAPAVELGVAGGRGALDPGEQAVDVVAHRRHEAFRIDAHPQHRRGDRRERWRSSRLSRSGIAAASAVRAAPNAIRQ